MATTDKTREARQVTRQARRVPTAGEDQYELTWPYFMYTIVLCFLLTTAVLWVWSMVAPAPLEPLADPNKTPNPSKAPWYFVGLQELLVYFDPWIAGVVLPTLIIVGLMAIPYIDKSPTWHWRVQLQGSEICCMDVFVGNSFLVHPDYYRLLLSWPELGMVLALGKLGNP